MIKSNLAVLLAERNLRITQVANDTGISRTTLTSLANNYNQGIQLDTLNKLCIYLQITPEQLFTYIPFDFNLIFKPACSDLYEFEFFFKNNTKTFKGRLLALTYLDEFTEDDRDSHILDIATELPCLKEPATKEYYPNAEKENDIMIKYFSQLPITFIKDIEIQMFNFIKDFLKTHDLNFPNLLELGIKSTKDLDFKSYNIEFPQELFEK